MTSGIFGASLASLTNGTTANAPDVLGSLQSLQNNGVNNDGGTIQTNGAGTVTIVTLAVTLGTLTRISKFTGTAINGKVTVSHGLGAVPDVVILIPSLSATPVAVALGYNPATLTSTQVDVWANTGFNFVGLAIKF